MINFGNKLDMAEIMMIFGILMRGALQSVKPYTAIKNPADSCGAAIHRRQLSALQTMHMPLDGAWSDSLLIFTVTDITQELSTLTWIWNKNLGVLPIY